MGMADAGTQMGTNDAEEHESAPDPAAPRYAQATSVQGGEGNAGGTAPVHEHVPAAEAEGQEAEVEVEAAEEATDQAAEAVAGEVAAEIPAVSAGMLGLFDGMDLTSGCASASASVALASAPAPAAIATVL